MKAKIIYTIILVLSVLSLNYNAKPIDDEKLEIIEKNCYHSLMHLNEGIKESAIFVSMQFKNRYPEHNDDRFIETLDELVQKSESAVISYKAYLAKLYFTNNELFNDIDLSTIMEEEKAYSEISEKINRIILSAKSN